VVEAIHDQLEADEYARKNTHDDDRGGPRSPCHSADEAERARTMMKGARRGRREESVKNYEP
jgi:hypothetical protein